MNSLLARFNRVPHWVDSLGNRLYRGNLAVVVKVSPGSDPDLLGAEVQIMGQPAEFHSSGFFLTRTGDGRPVDVPADYCISSLMSDRRVLVSSPSTFLLRIDGAMADHRNTYTRTTGDAAA